ncbi:unnamed protein product [Linum tenue]|uniref:Light-mediated development protein DET1 n=1 Tax=Linum tenue TaxID=586396 RepID=A0AAV0MTB6_9ROSI|nr:unnamed protein product [Linum tenue]
MFRNSNITARLFDRQISAPAPGTSVNCNRRFYENLVPSHTIYDVECPDLSFCKFTHDGRYLITFSRNHQDLIVYRPTWLSYSCEGEVCDLPSKARRFESFFTQLYSVTLASSGTDVICKEFFLYMEGNQFGIFATSTTQIQDTPAIGGAIQGVPSFERIAFHLLRLEDGIVLDEKVFQNDYVNLNHDMGVLYDDLLAIVSIRYQRIQILQIRESGHLVDVRALGAFCYEDDELFLNSSSQCMHQLSENHAENGLHANQPNPDSLFLSGIKQRLLSFIFRGIWNEEVDRSQTVQSMKKKFYFHFQDYVDLIIWKVQFLDRHHLLIKFGSVEGVNSAYELCGLFEQFGDHFYSASRNLLHLKFISSHSNNIHASDQLRIVKNKASSSLQFIRKILASLPFSCQSQSPSPYFDHSLFRYDEKLISATERHRTSVDHPIKFISRRQPSVLKFKIKPGPEAGNVDNRTRKASSFLFHPFLPLALSIQQSMHFPPSMNIHYRQ